MISIIIPLYNKEPIIEQSLQSVLSQDYDDFEVIVVNDGSTDKSAEIVKSIKDPRITLIEQEHGGPSKARNTGVKHANGDWILFLDADDELLPGALLEFDNIANKYSECNFLTCSYYVRNLKNELVLHEMKEGKVQNVFRDFFLYRFHTRTGVAIYRHDLVMRNPFNEQLRRYEDFDVWLRMFNTAEVYCSSVPVLVENQKYSEASTARKNISEDFVGHLNFTGKSFWNVMCLYKLYIEERENYKKQIEKLYPYLRLRFDLLILYKLSQNLFKFK